ncbi:hypothetical protein [Cellulophaga sp. Hel_I_12]|uniref:hypothetical protein n=1 Tax=Cellulophaga sp. Hel_I_12 TaxID=1249972 RepID=UPI0006479009|nr:hypothetical protein [Cellulophaga sp. Hel_I_12]
MKNNILKYTYLEWLSAEEMHETIKQWLSELNFIKDEQLFLNDLVQSYTRQLIDTSFFKESKNTIINLKKLEDDLGPLLKMVQKHEKQLEIMVDTIDQLEMEKAYLETHKKLIVAISTYIEKNRAIKKELFKIVSLAIKKDKRLLH